MHRWQRRLAPGLWSRNLLADIRSQEKALMNEVSELLGTSSNQFKLAATTTVFYDGGSFLLANVKDGLVLGREIGNIPSHTVLGSPKSLSLARRKLP